MTAVGRELINKGGRFGALIHSAVRLERHSPGYLNAYSPCIREVSICPAVKALEKAHDVPSPKELTASMLASQRL